MKKLELNQMEALTAGSDRGCMIMGGLALVSCAFGVAGIVGGLAITAGAAAAGCFD